MYRDISVCRIFRPLKRRAKVNFWVRENAYCIRAVGKVRELACIRVGELSFVSISRNSRMTYVTEGSVRIAPAAQT